MGAQTACGYWIKREESRIKANLIILLLLTMFLLLACQSVKKLIAILRSQPGLRFEKQSPIGWPSRVSIAIMDDRKLSYTDGFGQRPAMQLVRNRQSLLSQPWRWPISKLPLSYLI
jgi:uncharacterized lipoprotein YajG